MEQNNEKTQEKKTTRKPASGTAAATTTVLDALLDIQVNMQVKKDRIGRTVSGEKYPYFSLDSILSSLSPYLEKHQVVVTFEDTLQAVGNRLFMCSTIRLSKTDGSGTVSASGYAEFGYDRSRPAAIVTGGCTTYARKYAASALFKLDDSTVPPVPDPDAETCASKTDTAAVYGDNQPEDAMPAPERQLPPEPAPADETPDTRVRLTKEHPAWNSVVCEAARSYRDTNALREDLQNCFIIDDATFAQLVSEAGL